MPVFRLNDTLAVEAYQALVAHCTSTHLVGVYLTALHDKRHRLLPQRLALLEHLARLLVDTAITIFLELVLNAEVAPLNHMLACLLG